MVTGGIIDSNFLEVEMNKVNKIFNLVSWKSQNYNLTSLQNYRE